MRYAHLAGLLVTATLIFFLWWLPFDYFGKDWYDFKSNLYATDTKPQDSRFVIIDIDEKSLEIEGRWPWPRTRIADLLSILVDDYNVALIGIDVLFPDKTKDDITFYRRLAGLPLIFAQAFQFVQAVPPGVSDEIISEKPLQKGALLSPVGLVGSTSEVEKIPVAAGYLAINTPNTQQHSWSGGHITPVVDADGKVRKITPLIRWQDNYYEMLALSMVRRLLLLPDRYQLKTGKSSGLPSLQLINGPLTIKMDNQGNAWIPYQSKPGRQSAYYSASDILRGEIDSSALKGKLIILGSTATGLYDQIATPVAGIYPAAELHTTLLAALLDNNWIYRPVWEPVGQTVVLLALYLFCFSCFSRNQNVVGIVVIVIAVSVWVGLSLLAWQIQWHIRVWPVVTSAALLLAVYVSTGLIHHYNLRRSLQTLFSAYVHPAVVDQLLKQPDKVVGITPEKRELTVLFADVRGFTALAEKTPPDQLADIMTGIFDVMTAAVQNYGGTVDKYMGDALMAFWGAPLADDDHAYHALQAVEEMQLSLKQLSKEYVAMGRPAISVGIGVNTGEMVVGDIGSGFRHCYTVIGDSVNQAARLQKMTQEQHKETLIGSRTYELLPEGRLKNSFGGLGAIEIKGRRKPAQIYALATPPEQ